MLKDILNLVEKTENEISSTNDTVAGDVYIGTGETDTIRVFPGQPGSCRPAFRQFIIIS